MLQVEVRWEIEFELTRNFFLGSEDRLDGSKMDRYVSVSLRFHCPNIDRCVSNYVLNLQVYSSEMFIL